MAAKQDPKTPFEQEHSTRLSGVTRIIRTRNSPQSRYVRDFQALSKSREVNVQRNIIQQLDLATLFKALSFVTIQDVEQTQPELDTLEDAPHAFPIDSPEPSPTTTEEDIELEDVSDVPDLVPNTDSGQCSTVSSSSDINTPRRVVSPILLRKRPLHYGSYSVIQDSPPSSQHVCCHKRLRRDSWSGCPRNIEK